MPHECSDYCVNMRPEKQRKIIKEELEFLERAARYRFKLQKNNKRFLISAAWWARWKDFVEFESNDSSIKNDKKEDHECSSFMNSLRINLPSFHARDSTGNTDLLLI